MYSERTRGLAVSVLMACAVVAGSRSDATLANATGAAPQSGGTQQIDLAQRLAAATLKVVNREATALQESPGAVHVTAKPGVGLVWIDGSDFAEGALELDIRGRDVLQQSFVGIAFHGKDDTTYEAVYLRPFNFRAEDPIRHQHAVQYIASPDYDWPRLRKEFPEEFENPVHPSIGPTDWVPVRVVVKGSTIQVYVGQVASVTLEVRKLGQQERGLVGLWVGNNSDGDFRNLRITPMK